MTPSQKNEIDGGLMSDQVGDAQPPHTQRGSMADRRYRFRAQKFGRLIMTNCIQGTCRRIVDRATTHDQDGNVYESVAVILRPWRRNEWGEYLPQRALVVGWRR